MHGGGVFYNRIIRWNLLLYKLPGRIFSCINLKSCNRQGMVDEMACQLLL